MNAAYLMIRGRILEKADRLLRYGLEPKDLQVVFGADTFETVEVETWKRDDEIRGDVIIDEISAGGAWGKFLGFDFVVDTATPRLAAVRIKLELIKEARGASGFEE